MAVVLRLGGRGGLVSWLRPPTLGVDLIATSDLARDRDNGADAMTVDEVDF